MKVSQKEVLLGDWPQDTQINLQRYVEESLYET